MRTIAKIEAGREAKELVKITPVKPMAELSGLVGPVCKIALENRTILADLLPLRVHK